MATRFDDWEGDFLEHHGVLGMKWGIRRYQNPDGSLTSAGKKHYQQTGEYGYHYKSHATKKYDRKQVKSLAKMMKAAYKGNEKKADKYAEKADKFGNRKRRSEELDRREQAAAERVSTGKAIVTRLLFSPAASKAYQQYRAMAGGGEHGTATKNLARALSWYGGTVGSRIAKAAYIRKGEKDHGVANTVNKVGSKALKSARKDDDALRGLGYIAKAGLADGISNVTGRPNRKYPLPSVATPEEERRAARKSRKG